MKNLMQKSNNSNGYTQLVLLILTQKKTINGFFEGFFWVLREICVYKLMSSEEN